MTQQLTRQPDRETPERLRRWPTLLARFPFVRIYSATRRAYWLGMGAGYTDDPAQSQVWPIALAFWKTKHCGPDASIELVNAGPAESA